MEIWWRRPSPMPHVSIKGQSNGGLLFFSLVLVVAYIERPRLKVVVLSFLFFFLLLLFAIWLPPFIQAKKKRLCISFETREKTNGNLTARISDLAVMPFSFLFFFSLIYYSGSCCCKISPKTRVQGGGQFPAAAWLLLWFNGSSRPTSSPRFHHHLFTPFYLQPQSSRFKSLLLFGEYFLLCSYAWATL